MAEHMHVPLTRKELDQEQCHDPMCSHGDDCVLYIHAGCHRHAAVEACYDKQHGVLHFHCKICRTHVATIAVAQ